LRCSVVELKSMAASPPLDLKDVFLRGRWREALFLTYSFDLPFFETYVLPVLVRGGCRSVAVAACGGWLPEPLRAWSEAGDVREAGRSYTLSTVSLPGAFHPKLVLAVGEGRGVVLVGSGNVSTYGMAMGGELFTLVEWEGGEVPQVARESWQLCREIARHLPVDRSFAERVEALGRFVPGLAAPVVDRVLVHNLSHPIIDQLVQHLSDEPVEELVAWAPFTDRRLAALDALIERTRPRRVVVGVQPDLTSLDGARLAALAAHRSDVAWEVRALRQRDATRPSLIHAKGVLAVLSSGAQVALIGSPNLSAPALLRTANSGNFELAVLHRGCDLREKLFGEDSIVTLGDTVQPSSLTWTDDPTTAAQSRPRPAVQLLGARQDGEWLAVEVQGSPPAGTMILLDSATSLPMTRANEGWGAALAGGLTPRTAELIWQGGRSGPVIVADLARLAAMRRGGESRHHTPLDALDYGADSDILALLDQLAQLAIGSVSDVDRMLRGRGAPTPQEEADEAAGQAPTVRLEDIDFERIRQHPRAHAYGRAGGGGFDAPRIQLWLDEVVQQFQSLRERQLLRVVQPIVTDDGEEEPASEGDTQERQRWPVSRRIAVRVRNRLRRYVTGIGDPRFWRLVDPEWMTTNYVLFLSLLERLWVRADTAAAILPKEDLGSLTMDLVAGYWGDDRRGGYASCLSEDARWSSAVLLTEHHGDALTAASCIRLLEVPGDVGRNAPFVVGEYARVGHELGLVTDEVLERALVFLDRADDLPAPYVQRLLGTADYFSWDRFASNLAWRHGLRSATLLADVPGVGRFVSGEVLVVDGGESLVVSEATLQVFGQWVQEVCRRDPRRDVIQMVWGAELILIYDATTREVLTRHRRSEGRLETRVVATAVEPAAIPTLTLDQQSPGHGVSTSAG
jgi:hypothetical protein